jgi:hypothetical protein
MRLSPRESLLAVAEQLRTPTSRCRVNFRKAALDRFCSRVIPTRFGVLSPASPDACSSYADRRNLTSIDDLPEANEPADEVVRNASGIPA